MTSTPNPNIVPEITDTPGEPLFYSNFATIRSTPEEILIHFGLRTDEPSKGVGVAKAVLSLAHAKRLAGALARVIETYEKSFGSIQEDISKRLTPEGRKLLGIPDKEESSPKDA